jgi:hypothetical protein
VIVAIPKKIRVPVRHPATNALNTLVVNFCKGKSLSIVAKIIGNNNKESFTCKSKKPYFMFFEYSIPTRYRI